MGLCLYMLSFRAFLFGGVQDLEEDDDDEDDEASGQFFNELFSLQVDNEKASWQKSKSNYLPVIHLKISRTIKQAGKKVSQITYY